MSFSKIMKTNEIIRNSFEDRFCDDLSEVILQFLPLKDKFRFECVSKQFQRTVFQKEYHLDLSQILFQMRNLSINQKKEVLETLLKKLVNIRSFRSLYLLNDSDIDLMVKYCNNLMKINVILSQISETKRKAFVDKFGSKLISICYLERDLQWIQNSFPQIQELITPLCLPDGYEIRYLADLRLKNLKKVKCHLFANELSSNQVVKQFQQFVENHKSLTHLTINLNISDEDIFELLFNILELNQLTCLHIGVLTRNYPVPDIQFELENDIKLMAVYCPYLKSLSIHILIYSSIEISIINELIRLPKLKRISLKPIAVDKTITSAKLFDGLQSLTHLELSVDRWGVYFQSQLLKNIHMFLPKLQRLEIIDSPIKVTEKTADTLSRLSRLESLRLIVDKKTIRDLIEKKVKENCKKLKSIEIIADYYNFAYFQ